MHGQWEVVAKRKEKGNKNIPQKITNDLKSKAAEKININDILPKSQLKNLYNGSSKNTVSNETKKSQEKGIKGTSEVKKPQKKPEKNQEVTRHKHKSIESALNTIDVEDFKTIFERSKSLFPEAPIVWLKELAQFLNQKLYVDIQDVLFKGKPFGYPLKIVPQPLKTIMEKALKEAGKSAVNLFFDISLTAMATDMAKGLPALGHKLFLQLISLSDPSAAITSMNKHQVLRNSYQNRPNIGLSILWVVGQAGSNDFNIGFKVFKELMIPLIDLKHYSTFIVGYLHNLLSKSDDAITKEDYFFIIDTLFTDRKNLPVDKSEINTNKTIEFAVYFELMDNLESFNERVLKSYKNQSCFSLFESVLKRLCTPEANTSQVLQNCLCDLGVKSIYADEAILKKWESIYSKTLLGSGNLFEYIVHHWSPFQKRVNKKLFSITVESLQEINNELNEKKKRDVGLKKSEMVLAKISSKMVAAKKSSSFPFKTFLLFLSSFLLGTFIVADVKNNGSWEKSSTREFLKTSGVCEYTHKAINGTKDGFTWVDTKIEQSFPDQRRAVVDFSEPYFMLARDFGLTVYNVGSDVAESFSKKYPAVKESIDTYAPGFVETTQNLCVSFWSNTLFYSSRSVEYLKKEVFVGQLSPENMQKVVLQAFNTTQQKATECYHWLYEKVQTTIK